MWGAFLTVGKQGRERSIGLGNDGDVATLVPDQRWDPVQPVELGTQPADSLGSVEALFPMVFGSVQFRARFDATPYSTSTMSRPCAVNAQITVMAIAIITSDQTG